MIRRLSMLAAFAGLAVGAAAWWRRHPRFGAAWVTRVVDPWLVRQGVVEKSEGEIGLIEHVGRKSGTVRVSPVHPAPIDDGFRIIVPLGLESHWALNVLAAGRCRLQIGDVVYELDEPVLISPMAVDDLPGVARRVMDWLGFRYLRLHRRSEGPGKLDLQASTADQATSVEPVTV
jgi:deazaflavin-dependent oxidoreductase (nitroreductase family)